MAILRPIVLFTPDATLTSDDGGVDVTRYELAPPPSSLRPPYHSDQDARKTLSYVPSLTYFAINALLEWPDQVHSLGPRQLRYNPPSDRTDFDILQALIPTYRPFSPDHDHFDLSLVDPRLWAVLAQIYEDLPPAFHQYSLPLSDAHLPLIQRIPSTSHFSLITVLSLARCRQLTDDTVVNLRALHTLAAFDASQTALGWWGIQRLVKTFSWTDDDDDDDPDQGPQRRGPWGLRVLYLTNCINVDNRVLDSLPRFPLLSVVDLRGTVCKPSLIRSSPFRPSSDTRLYDPANLTGVLEHLSSSTEEHSTLFSNHNPYILHVDSLHHKANPARHAHAANPWNTHDVIPSPERGQQIAKGRVNVFLPPNPPRDEPPPYVYAESTVDYIFQNPDEMLPEDDDDDDGGEDSLSDDISDYSEDAQPPGPRDLSDPHWGEGLGPRRIRPVPQPDVPRSWMDAAEDEQRVHRNRAGAAKFYGNPAPRRPSSMPTFAGLPPRTPAATPLPKPADPLMLARTPPPWGSLPSEPQPPAKPNTTSPSKRKRAAEDIAPAQRAQKRMHTLSEIQRMHLDVLPKRPTSTAKEQAAAAASLKPPAGRANPFMRKAHAGKPPAPASSTSTAVPAAEPSAKRTASQPKPRPSLKSNPPAGTSATQAVEKTTIKTAGKRHPAFAAPAPLAVEGTQDGPRPAKKPKMVPISSLPVPPWPEPARKLKPLSEHRKRLSLASSIQKAQKQTTLAVTVTAPRPLCSGGPDDANVPQAQRRASAPVSAPKRLEMTPGRVEKGKGVAGEPKSKGSEKQRRKSSGGGKGFDWESWGAS